MSDKLQVVADIGGVSGVFDYNGGALPILIGYRVVDEDYGENISMPILDIEILPGKYDPLYGTLNDLFTGQYNFFKISKREMIISYINLRRD